MSFRINRNNNINHFYKYVRSFARYMFVYILKKNTKKTKIKAKLAFASSNHKRFIVLLLFKYFNKSNNEK